MQKRKLTALLCIVLLIANIASPAAANPLEDCPLTNWVDPYVIDITELPPELQGASYAVMIPPPVVARQNEEMAALIASIPELEGALWITVIPLMPIIP